MNNLFQLHNPNYNNPNNVAAPKKKKFTAWFTKKKIIIIIVVILVGGGLASRIFKGDNGNNIQTDTVKKQNIKQTVLATGQVTSQTDLSLSFKVSGIVARVNFKEGGQVKAGQELANLQQGDQLASLTQARGALAQAQANYEKVLAGASNEDITVSQRAVEAAEVSLNNAQDSLKNSTQQQQILVDNAYKALLNSTLSAVAASSNLSTATVTVSGTYTGTGQGTYVVEVYGSGSGPRFSVSGLEADGGAVKASVPMPIGTKGLSIQFSTITVYAGDKWTIEIPNTKASTYVTNYNAYLAALETQRVTVASAENAVATAKAALDQAKAALDLKRAQARPAEIEVAKAQILTAQGQVQAAGAALDNTIIRAPADGTVTKVDIKPGELATALKEVLVLQDINNLHIEANISEANIAYIKIDQPVEITFDALGPDRIFKGTVKQIDPASTVISGVVNYKVTVSLDKLEEIKPGMTANISILTAQKDNVLAIPSRAVISKDSKKFVRVITDSKKKTYKEAEATTGLEADEGVTEILSGLTEGQEIVTFVKQK